jgi:hypothetical protein
MSRLRKASAVVALAAIPLATAFGASTASAVSPNTQLTATYGSPTHLLNYSWACQAYAEGVVWSSQYTGPNTSNDVSMDVHVHNPYLFAACRGQEQLWIDRGSNPIDGGGATEVAVLNAPTACAVTDPSCVSTVDTGLVNVPLNQTYTNWVNALVNYEAGIANGINDYLGSHGYPTIPVPTHFDPSQYINDIRVVVVPR